MFRPAVIALLLLATLPLDCNAYIDPNAGGILFQLLAPLLAAIAGVWMFLRRWISQAVRQLWNALTGRSDK